MTTYAFPGGDTGKRWHVMRMATIEDRDSRYWLDIDDLISICGTFTITKYTLDQAKKNPDRTWNDILLEAEVSPNPQCAHCARMSSN